MIARAAASDVGLDDALRLLIAKGVDVNARDKAGETALDIARRHGRTTTVDVLKNAGAALATHRPRRPWLPLRPRRPGWLSSGPCRCCNGPMRSF